MRKTADERKLDAMLAQWAGRNTLTPVRAEAIRIAARTTADALSHQTTPDSDWWKRLFRGISHAVCLSTDARRYLPAASHPIL